MPINVLAGFSGIAAVAALLASGMEWSSAYYDLLRHLPPELQPYGKRGEAMEFARDNPDIPIGIRRRLALSSSLGAISFTLAALAAWLAKAPQPAPVLLTLMAVVTVMLKALAIYRRLRSAASRQDKD